MAEVDTSFYRIQPKSAFDYMQELAGADDAKAQRQRNALALLIQQGQVQDAQQARGIRNSGLSAVQALGGGATDDQRISALRGAGDYGTADTLEKSMLERQKTGAQVEKDKAATEKDRLANQASQINLVLQAVSSARDQPSYERAIQFLRSNGVELGAVPPQYDPQAVAAFGQMALTAKDRVEQALKAQEFKLKANNELISPDGSVNQPLLGAKKQVARSGAPSISVNTEKSYAGHVAEGLAKNDVAALDAARTAPDRINTARSIKKVLDSNQALTGTGAEVRLEITKALSTAGLIDGASTTATEDLASMLASQTLDAIKSSGLGSGQGFTDKDRQFLQDAKSGRITINAGTLRRMADLNERSGLAAIDYGNKIAKRLKDNPAMGNVGQELEVQPPVDKFQQAIDAEAKRRGLK